VKQLHIRKCREEIRTTGEESKYDKEKKIQYTHELYHIKKVQKHNCISGNKLKGKKMNDIANILFSII